MLYEFKSRATGSVTMTQDVGSRMLELIGKSVDAKGIISVDQMPAAIAKLEAAARGADSGSKSASNSAAGKAAGAGSESEDEAAAVGLGQRIFPLVEMLKRAHAAGKDITWGV